VGKQGQDEQKGKTSKEEPTKLQGGLLNSKRRRTMLQQSGEGVKVVGQRGGTDGPSAEGAN